MCLCRRRCWDLKKYRYLSSLRKHQTGNGTRYCCPVDPEFHPLVHNSTVFVDIKLPEAADEPRRGSTTAVHRNSNDLEPGASAPPLDVPEDRNDHGTSCEGAQPLHQDAADVPLASIGDYMPGMEAIPPEQHLVADIGKSPLLERRNIDVNGAFQRPVPLARHTCFHYHLRCSGLSCSHQIDSLESKHA